MASYPCNLNEYPSSVCYFIKTLALRHSKVFIGCDEGQADLETFAVNSDLKKQVTRLRDARNQIYSISGPL